MPDFTIWRTDGFVMIRTLDGAAITLKDTDAAKLGRKLMPQKRGYNLWSRAKKDKLRELYLAGDLTLRQIGEQFGVSDNAIHSQLQKLGITNRKPGTAAAMRGNQRARKVA